jgi:hypothetical protein
LIQTGAGVLGALGPEGTGGAWDSVVLMSLVLFGTVLHGELLHSAVLHREVLHREVLLN